MKVTDVKVHLLSFPLPTGAQWRTASGFLNKRDAVIVEVFTDDGIIGYGESNHATAPKVVAQIIDNVLKPLVLGCDPFYHPRIWKEMYDRCFLLGQTGVGIIAISGIEIALLDIVGKTLGVSISRLLGRSRDRVRVYAGGASLGWQEPKKLAEESKSLVNQGFTALKLRIGKGLKEDLQSLEAVRAVIGDDVDIIVDANCAFNYIEALQMSGELEKFNILWFEEPLPYNDITGYHLLSQQSRVPIAAGENFFTSQSFQNMMSVNALNILQPDCCKVGGLMEAYKVACLASSYNLPCAPHIFASAVGMAANLQLLAAIPNGFICEYDALAKNPFRDDIIAQPYFLENGYIRIPDEPGLGISICNKKFKKYPFLLTGQN